jgi:hypothetical protein
MPNVDDPDDVEAADGTVADDDTPSVAGESISHVGLSEGDYKNYDDVSPLFWQGTHLHFDVFVTKGRR